MKSVKKLYSVVVPVLIILFVGCSSKQITEGTVYHKYYDDNNEWYYQDNVEERDRWFYDHRKWYIYIESYDKKGERESERYEIPENYWNGIKIGETISIIYE